MLPDVEHIHTIIEPYACEGTLLPRSIPELRENVRHFVVAEEDTRIFGRGEAQVGTTSDIGSAAADIAKLL